MFEKKVRNGQLRLGHDLLMEKLNKTQLSLIQIKNGKTIFEDQSLKLKYQNPYVGFPPVKENLKKFL